MTNPDLFTVCIAALVAVFALLISLAAAMRLITLLFPERADDEAAMYAAIAATYRSVYPGTRITKIEDSQ
ncbi:MAG: hypothetical protein KAJ12_09430 [Bacteroidetes bacterium]|nr:hypothetical protein [Bacteroidota bacterium]